MFETATNVVAHGAGTNKMTANSSAYMRYHGQGHEIEIPLIGKQLKQDDIALLRQQFEQEYTKQYSRVVPEHGY